MTPSAVDAILILTRMPEYQLTTPLLLPMQLKGATGLLIDLMVSDCRVLMERMVDRR